MSADALLLLLRILSTAALLAFFGLLIYFTQRELRLTERLLERNDTARGELVVTHPDGGEERVQLRPVLSIGRTPQNVVVLNNTYTSAQHALITFRDRQWWVEDLDSRNGTLVNDILVDEPTVISAGDEIVVGDVALRLELD